LPALFSFLRARPAPFSRRRAAHLRLGRRGERLAARLLRDLGVDVLVRNYRCPAGEIDLVARDGDTFCFVEVKTRRRPGRARPADALRGAQRRRIVRAAHRYLRETGWPPVPYRFDIVELVVGRWRVRDVRYWRGAFSAEPFTRGARFPTALRPERGQPAADW